MVLSSGLVDTPHPGTNAQMTIIVDIIDTMLIRHQPPILPIRVKTGYSQRLQRRNTKLGRKQTCCEGQNGGACLADTRNPPHAAGEEPGGQDLLRLAHYDRVHGSQQQPDEGHCERVLYE